MSCIGSSELLEDEMAAALKTNAIREYICPFCGLIIIGDDDAMTFSHQLPVCSSWEATTKEFGGVDAGISVWIGTSDGKY